MLYCWLMHTHRYGYSFVECRADHAQFRHGGMACENGVAGCAAWSVIATQESQDGGGRIWMQEWDDGSWMRGLEIQLGACVDGLDYGRDRGVDVLGGTERRL